MKTPSKPVKNAKKTAKTKSLAKGKPVVRIVTVNDISPV
jgi:hypothetical protein